MGTLSKGYTFGATETVTNAKLHSLIDDGTISGIVNADISASAAIAASKVDFGGAVPGTGENNTWTGSNTFSGNVIIGTANQGDVWYDDGTKMTRLTPGTSGYFLKTQGAAADPVWAAQSSQGLVLQEVYAEEATTVDITTVMPNDDSIPQSNEGVEVLTQAITAAAGTNVVEINCIISMSGEASEAILTAALYQDSTAGALRATQITGESNKVMTWPLNHRMVIGTASETTFKVRVGVNSGDGQLNGADDARLLGGVMITSIQIKEISV